MYCSDQCQGNCDKRKVANFYAGAKESEREGNVTSRQTRRAEPASETKAVQEAKRERHQPWLALRQSLRILMLPQNLVRDKENAQGYDCFHRSWWHVDKT